MYTGDAAIRIAAHGDPQRAARATAPARPQHEAAVLQRPHASRGWRRYWMRRATPGRSRLPTRRAGEPGAGGEATAADDLIGLAAGLAKVVAGMHGRGVLHRDICPANIVLSS